MNKNLGFVILHYNTEEETVACVNSILQHLSGANVVIVDNGSPNGSGQRLKEKYRELSVKVICLDSNLGFAKGNNVGIQYLRNNTMVKFIITMNSDTLIEQDDFEKVIEQEYYQSQFAVMGPQITTKNGEKNSNPVEYIVDSEKKVKKLILKRSVKLFLNKIHMNKFIKDVGTGVRIKGIYDSDKRYENVKLHGACWIFSPKFFEIFTGLCDKTFLYFEEDILFFYMKKTGLKTVYNPKINIIHLEDATSNSISKTSREKNIFVLKNEIKSLKVLKEIICEA